MVREFGLGEIIVIKLEVVEQSGCVGCHFNGDTTNNLCRSNDSCWAPDMICTRGNRSDNRSVIFRKMN